MPPVRCWHVDAFTDRPFAGNPAAVCWLESEAEPQWMQSVAAEMNLSETAFARPLADGYELRWFTPTVEVDLCGHATLATAHALWDSNVVDRTQPLRFHTRSGLLTCTLNEGLIELDFPATPATMGPVQPELAEALGTRPTEAGRTRFDLLAVFDSADVVRSLTPDFRRIGAIPARGVIVTAPSDDPRYHCISRFFAPAVGVDEDPVCGSAHCCLAPYWGARLDRNELVAYQASARGGVLRLRLYGDRVVLGGKAVTVMKGELA